MQSSVSLRNSLSLGCGKGLQLPLVCPSFIFCVGINNNRLSKRCYTSFVGKTIIDRIPERAIKTQIETLVQETPTVKSFTLTPTTTDTNANQPFLQFLPGQWCDIFLPTTITTDIAIKEHPIPSDINHQSAYTMGLSMTSSPLLTNRYVPTLSVSLPIERQISEYTS